MLFKKTNLTSFFILSLLFTHIAKASNSPERKRYVILVVNNGMNEFRTFSAIKRDNTYTHVSPFGSADWWDGSDIPEDEDEDNPIFPLISSLDQLGVNDLNL